MFERDWCGVFRFCSPFFTYTLFGLLIRWIVFEGPQFIASDHSIQKIRVSYALLEPIGGNIKPTLFLYHRQCLGTIYEHGFHIPKSFAIINCTVSLLIPSVSAMYQFEIRQFVASSSSTRFTFSSLRVETSLPKRGSSSSDSNELPICKAPLLSVLHCHKLYVTSWEHLHHHLPVLRETSRWHVAPLSTCSLFSTEALYHSLLKTV